MSPAVRQLDFHTAAAARAFVHKVSESFPVRMAILFGSRARGTHGSESDADIAVLLNGPPAKFLATKLEMADIAYDILLETGIRVQPLPIWLSEWEHPENYSNPRLLQNIEREGIKL